LQNIQQLRLVLLEPMYQEGNDAANLKRPESPIGQKNLQYLVKVKQQNIRVKFGISDKEVK
jgi:hypothetical protein